MLKTPLKHNPPCLPHFLVRGAIFAGSPSLHYLSKYCMLSIQLGSGSKGEEELALIIIRTSVSHGNQPSTYKP